MVLSSIIGYLSVHESFVELDALLTIPPAIIIPLSFILHQPPAFLFLNPVLQTIIILPDIFIGPFTGFQNILRNTNGLLVVENVTTP